mmetsp:Transcript_94235/g.269877  ORF Transcript_94235/g.269877 Transcript_94235/m.269877 type:complete len:224 (+) Transcript_94235:1755-2426(+)
MTPAHAVVVVLVFVVVVVPQTIIIIVTGIVFVFLFFIIVFVLIAVVATTVGVVFVGVTVAARPEFDGLDACHRVLASVEALSEVRIARDMVVGTLASSAAPRDTDVLLDTVVLPLIQALVTLRDVAIVVVVLAEVGRAVKGLTLALGAVAAPLRLQRLACALTPVIFPVVKPSITRPVVTRVGAFVVIIPYTIPPVVITPPIILLLVVFTPQIILLLVVILLG